MKDPLGVSPSKGNQGTIRGNEKIILFMLNVFTCVFLQCFRLQQSDTPDIGKKTFFFILKKSIWK